MSWKECKKILVIRADNMGDLLMSSPAIRAVKQSLGCRITLLTSSQASAVAGMIPEIDEVMEFNVPWMKLQENGDAEAVHDLVDRIRNKKFDGCIVFNVYSQNPLPAVMIAYLGGIRLRLAYCRENPYGLLTDWVPDPEPFEKIKHQVERDLDLVARISCFVLNHKIVLSINADLEKTVVGKVSSITGGTKDSWIILHPGVSELKRRYPKEHWIAVGQLINEIYDCPVLITGTASEQCFVKDLSAAIGGSCYPVTGVFSIEELTLLIKKAKVLISVNTGPVHLAAATQTPVVVLYAKTNPQHKPWMVPHKVLEFSVSEELKSKNKVISWVDKEVYKQRAVYPQPQEILHALKCLL